ncbi:MAG: 1-deoxy-D-xylulose-5-phosphate reductoisomerase [Clostridiales Family XIII bacterium]|jgi:1-deoxy-D-xylulose-5-phosphate reductoisomerase|nr:1-deoxy-D-xylulose-5-phosphate reductoisomerase [Clostridiales Family XIII bacterium]
MKKIGIFGSTGSVGTQTVRIVEKNPDKLQATVLSCGGNTELFRTQIRKLKPALAVVSEAQAAEDAIGALAKEFPRTEFLTGADGLAQAAEKGGYDLMLNAISGIAGLVPTWRAIRGGKDIALANKETIVAGGELVMAESKKRGLAIIPVDSEHSAIFQCLRRGPADAVTRILLCGSGGPFRGYSKERLNGVTIRQALTHPNWKMGRKITVDSATMMNKGLELIETGRLFGIAEDRIEIVIQPQSIIHSMVEYADGAVIAQLGSPDMKGPISYALSFPERWPAEVAPLDFCKLKSLDFEPPDEETFSCLRLARAAMRAGGSSPIALNAANEILVQLFLDGKIRFLDIQTHLERAMDLHVQSPATDVDGILRIDAEVRAQVLKRVHRACSA